jgi:hypothetical protein
LIKDPLVSHFDLDPNESIAGCPKRGQDAPGEFGSAFGEDAQLRRHLLGRQLLSFAEDILAERRAQDRARHSRRDRPGVPQDRCDVDPVRSGPGIRVEVYGEVGALAGFEHPPRRLSLLGRYFGLPCGFGP